MSPLRRSIVGAAALAAALTVVSAVDPVAHHGGPALAASTRPPPAPPGSPGVVWGITNLTVWWKPVLGAGGYVVTIKSNSTGAVKTYRNSILPNNQAVIAKSALPAGSASGYRIRVQTRAKNGQLSTYSSVPKPTRARKPVIIVKKGDRAAATRAARVVNDCTKEGIYTGVGLAGGTLAVALFIPGLNVTAAGVLGAAAAGGVGGSFTCALKKIDPLG